MKKEVVGVVAGIIAGAIDVTPMIIQNLTWDANLSAITLWVVVGFLITKVQMAIHPILKGIAVAFLVLAPTAFLIGWHEPATLIIVCSMTLLLGGALGFTLGKLAK